VAEPLKNPVLPRAQDATKAMQELEYDSLQLQHEIDRREKAAEEKLGFENLPLITAATTPEQIAKLPAEIDRRVQAAKKSDRSLAILA
jgi:hypothetical protein